MRNLAALVCGILFGIGLAMSGMTDTAKVQGFLDLFGQWIPDLALVMGGAVVVSFLLTGPILKRASPLLAEDFSLPAKKVIDAPLLAGAACFGIGWGLYGYCPGPAISALAYLDWQAGLFVLAMLAGMAVAGPVERLIDPGQAESP